MKRFPMFLALVVLLAAGTARAGDAPDIEHGRQLQVQSCQRCHDDSIYTRKDSIIYSYKALVNRVHFCESMAHAGWDEHDFDDVIAYLNQRFYKFKTSP